MALGPGELSIVPNAVEHRPVAHEEVQPLLIEPSGTPNTGEKARPLPVAKFDSMAHRVISGTEREQRARFVVLGAVLQSHGRFSRACARMVAT